MRRPVSKHILQDIKNPGEISPHGWASIKDGKKYLIQK
jgi:hypothetical protein